MLRNNNIANNRRRPLGPDYRRLTPYGSVPRAPLAIRLAEVAPEGLSFQQRALEGLATRIGYRLTTFTPRDRRLVLADTLTVLEKFKFGHQLTKRPREMEEDRVMELVQDLIPETYIINTGISKAMLGKEGMRVYPKNLMNAACEYIRELQEEEVESARKRAVEARARKILEDQQEPLSIEKTLKRIEKWCEAWETGALKTEEWENFESCLRRSDI